MIYVITRHIHRKQRAEPQKKCAQGKTAESASAVESEQDFILRQDMPRIVNAGSINTESAIKTRRVLRASSKKAGETKTRIC